MTQERPTRDGVDVLIVASSPEFSTGPRGITPMASASNKPRCTRRRRIEATKSPRDSMNESAIMIASRN